LDGRPLRLDVTTAELGGDDEPLTAVFLRDATPRLRGESLAAALRETQVRRRQALEINDNVVQGLSAAMYSLAGGDVEASTSYLQATLTAARKLMNDWLDPIGGQKVGPGDLVRERASTLEPESPTDRGDAAPAAHEQPRVLIVDDFRDVRALLRMQLEAVGSYQVVGEAGDGVEAVELAAQLQPDVVLLDLAMPKMDGLQALPLIRDAVHGVRVIVLSGFDQGSMAQKALDAGADRYVEKGLRMNLAQVISGVLSAA
jgi:CheY-like chemotaxis protein